MAETPPAPPLNIPGDLPEGSALETLYVVRHGETAWNSEKRIQGSTDIPLAEAGEAQARRLAERFRGAAIDAIYSSPQQRALRTAEILGSTLGLEPVARAAFGELHCGSFEGKSYAEVRERHPAEYRAWMENPSVAAPGGESFDRFTARVGGGLREIFASGHRRVLLSGHSGTSRAALAWLLGLDFRLAIRFEQRNTSVSIFRWEEGRLRLRLWNGTRHLDDVL